MHEGHGFKDVGELGRTLVLVNIKEVRQHDTFSEDAFYLIENLIALLLNLWIALHHAAIDQTHADRTDFVDKRFRDRV